MKEVRVCWVFTAASKAGDVFVDGGLWYEDNRVNRLELKRLVDAGNRDGDDGSHWVQEREVSSLASSG